MILANYTQENRNTVRHLGIGFTNPMATFKPPLFNSFYTPDSVLTGLDLSAFNNGYNTHYCWNLPFESGGMGSVNGANGSGSISADALAVKLALADLLGSGEISDAIGSLIVQALADLTGSGEISSANLQAFLAAVADLTGSGTVAAPLTGLGELLGSLSGSGNASSTLTAIGELIAAITVTGTGLSTANVGEAVWAALAASNNASGTMGEKLNDAGSASNPWTEVIEAGFTAAEILRILAAHAAGAATGLEGANPQFLGLDGTTTRIDGTYSAGTRTIDSLDGT